MTSSPILRLFAPEIADRRLTRPEKGRRKMFYFWRIIAHVTMETCLHDLCWSLRLHAAIKKIYTYTQTRVPGSLDKKNNK